MSETVLGVAIGAGIAWGIPLVACAAWLTLLSITRRAARNRKRRHAAEIRASHRTVTTVDTIQREHYLVVIRNGRREVIDLGAEADQLETWVNDPANHRSKP